MRLVSTIAAILLFVAGCYAPGTDTLLEKRIEQATAATVRISTPGRSCTAFHVGDDILMTAAHCLDEQQLVFAEANDGTTYLAYPILIDEAKDLATLRLNKHFSGSKLDIMYDSDRKLRRGAQLVALGYPGYYSLHLIMEIGYIKDFSIVYGTKMIVSSALGFPGESGGPVIHVQSGKVVGVSDLISERINNFADGTNTHYHNTITYSISAPELEEMLERTRAYLAQAGGL